MKPVDPHNCEAFSKMHAEAFAGLVDRLTKATQHVPGKGSPERQKLLRDGIGSRTHRVYPRFSMER